MQLNMRLGDHAIIEPPRICAVVFLLKRLTCFVTHFEISLLQIITILISFFHNYNQTKLLSVVFQELNE